MASGGPPWQRSFRWAREPQPGIGKRKTVNSPSDAEVIGRSVDQPEAFGLIYDRHAPSVLRFLGRRVGAEVAEGLAGELFRIAFERRKTFDVSRSEEHTSELQSQSNLVCRLLLEKKKEK